MCKTHIGMYSTQRIFKLYVLSASVCFVYVFQEEGATLVLQVESIYFTKTFNYSAKLFARPCTYIEIHALYDTE